MPSYSIPNALMSERFASAMVRLEPAGWNIPSKRTGSPSSLPNGTTSSISKSIESATRTLCRVPSSSNWIAARSTPTTSPTSGASVLIGPPSSPLKTPTSFWSCSSVASSSTYSPSRQFPSVMTFGVSATTTTLRPATSVPSTWPSLMLKASVTRQ